MKKITQAILVSVSLLSSVSVFANTETNTKVSTVKKIDTKTEAAEAFIERISSTLVQKLAENKKEFSKNPQLLRKIAEDNIEPHIDFVYFSRHVMGKFVHRATPEQRNTFQETFRNALLRLYSSELGQFEKVSYKVFDAKKAKNPKYTVVPMQVTYEGERIAIKYLLYKVNSEWKIRNVQAENFQLGKILRDQFADVMSKQGNNIDKAIENFVPKAETK